MLGVFTAGTAVLAQNELFGGIGFISFGDVVEVPTFGAFQT